MALGPFQWQHPHSGTIFQRTLGNHPLLVLLNLDLKHRCLKLYLIPRFLSILFCILYLTYILDIVVLLYTTTYSYFRNCN